MIKKKNRKKPHYQSIMWFLLDLSIYFCYNVFTNFKEALKCALEEISIVLELHQEVGITIIEDVVLVF